MEGPDTMVSLCVRRPAQHEDMVRASTVGVANGHEAAESVEIVVS